MKIYVASSLNNAENATKVMNIFRFMGLQITYDWTTHGLVKDPVKCKEICRAEIDGVKRADVLVFLHPARSGSHVELGIALALHKPVFMLFPPEQEFSQLELKSFYYDDLVEWHHTFDTLMSSIVTFHTSKTSKDK